MKFKYIGQADQATVSGQIFPCDVWIDCSPEIAAKLEGNDKFVFEAVEEPDDMGITVTAEAIDAPPVHVPKRGRPAKKK